MEGNEDRSVRLWAQDLLFVSASLRPDGRLVINGQDLNAGKVFGDGVEEYEYAITVAASDVPRIVTALGGSDGDDVLTLLEEHGEAVVRRGDLTWLRDQGIEPDFWSRIG